MGKILLFLISSLLTVSNAQAFEAMLLGGLNYAAPTERISGVEQHWTGDSASAFGILLDQKLFDGPFDIESGVLFMQANYERDNNGITQKQSIGLTQVPLLFRFHFDDHVDVGFGGYLGFARGNRASELDAKDQGLIVSLRARMHLLPVLDLILDARYQHGLTNVASSATDLYNTRSVQILGGASYLF